MIKKISKILILSCAVLLALSSCSKDPLVRHKRLTNAFDGVPDLAPLDQLCEDNMAQIFNTYYEERLAEAASGDIESEKVVSKGSNHRPYGEKNCQGCHNFKQKNLLLAPADQLCEMCHVGFVRGKYVHGPVSVRDCLACHLPHSSNHKSLLQESVSEICSKCHQEERQAARMHKLVMQNNMECVNCHDAHGGDTPYFLK